VKRLDRGTFLKASGGALAGTYLLAGCDALSTKPAQQGNGQNGAVGKKGKEAPMLAEMVNNGQLPPVEERLPEEPIVLEPVERTGTYGGEWRRLIPGPADNFPLFMAMAYENLVRWQPDTKAYSVDEIIPGVARDFEFDEEGIEYTFELRKGMRWSDGEPFTADDIVFWYEDVLMNREISPAISSWLGKGEDPVRVEKTNDHSVRFVFAEPNGLFLHNLAAPQGAAITDHPAHYLKRFHKKYTPEVEDEAKEADLDSWVDLFYQKASWSENPEKPVLFGWKLTKALGEATSRIVAERNPYYWKVDPDGSQLPYVDRISFSVIQDPETMVLKAVNGCENTATAFAAVPKAGLTEFVAASCLDLDQSVGSTVRRGAEVGVARGLIGARPSQRARHSLARLPSTAA
jgi:ABC-type transport system substrate-binding protein